VVLFVAHALNFAVGFRDRFGRVIATEIGFGTFFNLRSSWFKSAFRNVIISRIEVLLGHESLTFFFCCSSIIGSNIKSYC
jgi:hypothetical protein